MGRLEDILDNYRIAIYKHFGPEHQEDKAREELREFVHEINKSDNEYVFNEGKEQHLLEGDYLEEQADLYNVLRQKYLCNPKMREFADKKIIRTIDRNEIVMVEE